MRGRVLSQLLVVELFLVKLFLERFYLLFQLEEEEYKEECAEQADHISKITGTKQDKM